MAGTFRFLKNIIFPPKCVFCGQTLEPNVKRNICGCCGDDIEFCSDSVCCEKCGKPILGFGEKPLCYFCANGKSKHFNRIISSFCYEGAVRDAIIKFKTKGIRAHCDVFSDSIVARIFEEYPSIQFDIICGAPPHNKKRNGFDQVEMLVRSISAKLAVPFVSSLFEQTRKTRKQSALKFKERLENMKDSLCVKEDINLDGKSVLLIDDVCTTRATITECSRALKKSGAKAVYAATIATVKNSGD